MGCSLSTPREDLFTAVLTDDKWLLRSTLRDHPNVVNEADPATRRTALSVAARHHNSHMMKELLAHGASTRLVDAKVGGWPAGWRVPCRRDGPAGGS